MSSDASARATAAERHGAARGESAALVAAIVARASRLVVASSSRPASSPSSRSSACSADVTPLVVAFVGLPLRLDRRAP